MFNEKSFNFPSPPTENLVISMTFIIILREKKKKKNPRVPLNYQSLKLECHISHKIPQTPKLKISPCFQLGPVTTGKLLVEEDMASIFFLSKILLQLANLAF